MTNTLHIKNELKQLTRLYAFLDQQAGTYELGELQSMQIKLALEEAVTNVIQYAYPDKKDQDTPAAPAPDQTVVAQAPVLAGCIQTSQRCSCYTDKGEQIEMDPGYCQSTTRARPDTLGGGNLDWGESTVRLEEPPKWTGTVISATTGNYF